MAAKERNDKILEEMEAEIAAKAADPNATPEAPVTTPAEEETPAPTSAEGKENQPPVETPAPAPAAQPEGGKPKGEIEELTEEEVQSLSGKARKRFESLSKKNIRLAEENAFLKKHAKQADEPIPATPAAPAFRLPWDGTPPEAVEEDVAVVARREALLAVAEERRQETIISNLQSDSTELETKFPEFDPKSESYDPTLVTKISVWYKGLFKDNNDLRLKDFVTELMSLREQGKALGKSEVTETVVRQAASQAVVPTAPSGPSSDSVVKKIQGARTIAELETLEAQI